MQALELMERALALLDECDAAAEIGAHLDLAIQRLRSMLASIPPNETSV